MDIDTLKAELQLIFKELIGASLMNARDGKNSTYYSHLFENIMGAFDDFEKLSSNGEDGGYEDPPTKYPLNGLKVVENSAGEQSRNLKFIAEELLIKVEHLLQKVSEKDHQQRLPRER
ncbi:MAG: hypothetical protein LLG04_18085 [Parachlamydia sp.]|nr:hypothetical protein [Parachlamydia sp.]